jgi:hypothetical protein
MLSQSWLNMYPKDTENMPPLQQQKINQPDIKHK